MVIQFRQSLKLTAATNFCWFSCIFLVDAFEHVPGLFAFNIKVKTILQKSSGKGKS